MSQNPNFRLAGSVKPGARDGERFADLERRVGVLEHEIGIVNVITVTPTSSPREGTCAVDTGGNFWFYAGHTWNKMTGSGGSGSVSSVFGRIGAVVAQSGDYTISQITNGASKAEVDERLIQTTTAETWSFTGTVPTGELGEAWGPRAQVGSSETQKLLGFGWHAKSGEAEVEILKNGSTLVATLHVKAEEGYTALGEVVTRSTGERLLLKVKTSTAKTMAVDAIVERLI